MDRLVGICDRAVALASGALTALGALGLAGLVAVTVVAVVARYLFNDPIFGIEDISSVLLAVVVAAAIAHAAREGGHVAVDVLSRLAGPRLVRVTDPVMRLLGAATIGTAAWALAVQGSCGFPCGAFTANLEILHRPFYWVLSFAFALYALELLLGLVPGRGGEAR